MDLWETQRTCGKYDGPVENPMDLWETQWTCGKPKGHVENPMDLWKTQWTCWKPNGHMGYPRDMSECWPLMVGRPGRRAKIPFALRSESYPRPIGVSEGFSVLFSAFGW